MLVRGDEATRSLPRSVVRWGGTTHIFSAEKWWHTAINAPIRAVLDGILLFATSVSGCVSTSRYWRTLGNDDTVIWEIFRLCLFCDKQPTTITRIANSQTRNTPKLYLHTWHKLFFGNGNWSVKFENFNTSRFYWVFPVTSSTTQFPYAVRPPFVVDSFSRCEPDKNF